MKKTSCSILLSVMFITFLACGMKAQERVVQMPNRDQLMSAHIRVLFQDKEGYMWYGMKSDGVYRDDGYQLTSFRADFLHPEVQMNNNVTALCEDNNNRIWIGTKRGLYILDKRDYSIHPTGDSKLQIWTFDALKAGQGDSVYAYANQHVLVYDGEGNCISQTPVDENPLVTPNRRELTDQKGNFWQIDKNGIPSVTIHPSVELEEVDLPTLPLCFNVPVTRAGLPEGHKIHSVWCTLDSTKYVSTSLGVWMVKGGGKNAEPEQVGPNFGVVNTLSPGENGVIYMNTEWQGLISYKDGQIAKLDTTIRNAYDIFYDDGKLWICTNDGKLLLYDVQKQEKVDMSKDCCLRGEAPIGLVVLKGNVWLLFNQKILIWSPRKKSNDKAVIRFIFPSDLDPRPAFFRRLYSDGHSRVYVECEKECFELKIAEESAKGQTPGRISLSAYTTIHGTYCLGMDTHQLHLKADERVVHLYFTTLDHLNTKHVRFAYRYQDESEWRYLEMGENDVLLTRLSNGERTIEVMATSANGQWMGEVYTLVIDREPYWYETVWACIAYVLVAVLLLGFCFWLGRKMSRR